LTGNGGADTFAFNVTTSTPAAFTPTVQAPAAVDGEMITITADNIDNGNEGFIVNYTLNGVGGALNFSGAVTAGVDFTDATAVAAAVAAALDGLPGIGASSALDTVHATGDNGNSLEITAVIPLGTVTTLAGAPANDGPADVAKTMRIDIANTTVTTGEKYVLQITTAENVVKGVTYVAAPGDGPLEIAIGLRDLYNAADGVEVNASVSFFAGQWGIDLNDLIANNGTFTLTSNNASNQGTFGGSGASNVGATLIATADVITDFLTGTDKIKLGLVAGSALDYASSAQQVDYATALVAATASMDGTVQYYMTSVAPVGPTAAYGVLFFDANADGAVDGVIKLVGLDAAHFAATDIIA
jgi:hypothetical protein